MHPRRPINSRRVPTHEKNSGDAVRRLGTIIQSIFCAQSGACVRLTVWKWSGESRYPGALPLVLENFRRAFSPDPTDWPRVSEDGWNENLQENALIFKHILSTTSIRQCKISLENLYMDVGALGLIHNTVWTTLLRIINSTHWAHQQFKTVTVYVAGIATFLS